MRAYKGILFYSGGLSYLAGYVVISIESIILLLLVCVDVETGTGQAWKQGRTCPVLTACAFFL